MGIKLDDDDECVGGVLVRRPVRQAGRRDRDRQARRSSAPARSSRRSRGGKGDEAGRARLDFVRVVPPPIELVNWDEVEGKAKHGQREAQRTASGRACLSEEARMSPEAPTRRELDEHTRRAGGFCRGVGGFIADDDSVLRHEEGGYIYAGLDWCESYVRRAPPGGSMADRSGAVPPVVPGCFLVATYHTHPTPIDRRQAILIASPDDRQLGDRIRCALVRRFGTRSCRGGAGSSSRRSDRASVDTRTVEDSDGNMATRTAGPNCVPVTARWPLPKPMHCPFTGTSARIGSNCGWTHDGWHVEYRDQRNRALTGGGPHYLIDATTGAIVSKKYYQ